MDEQREVIQCLRSERREKDARLKKESKYSKNRDCEYRCTFAKSLSKTTTFMFWAMSGVVKLHCLQRRSLVRCIFASPKFGSPCPSRLGLWPLVFAAQWLRCIAPWSRNFWAQGADHSPDPTKEKVLGRWPGLLAKQLRLNRSATSGSLSQGIRKKH